ncbi:J domain-containing protein [Dyella silvae]|uniref:J domain-containing protein n=1 Tax=Dyella silvae TaxID=2994424 RepID=UPI002263C6AE|nr:J domain-containing protein [Dyella silvae]
MANETDFLDMYRTLGLRPGCSLPVFKQAYRRQVARMHPDRQGGTSDPATAARLQRLISQYDAAMVFQREHGRLPGAMPQVRFSVPEASAPVFQAPAAPRTTRKWRAVLVFVLLVVIVALAWQYINEAPVPEPSNASSDTQA